MGTGTTSLGVETVKFRFRSQGFNYICDFPQFVGWSVGDIRLLLSARCRSLFHLFTLLWVVASCKFWWPLDLGNYSLILRSYISLGPILTSNHQVARVQPSNLQDFFLFDQNNFILLGQKCFGEEPCFCKYADRTTKGVHRKIDASCAAFIDRHNDNNSVIG